jgi:hypothetical protein
MRICQNLLRNDNESEEERGGRAELAGQLAGATNILLVPS